MDYGEESANRLWHGIHSKTTVRKSCEGYDLPQMKKEKGRAPARPFSFRLIPPKWGDKLSPDF